MSNKKRLGFRLFLLLAALAAFCTWAGCGRNSREDSALQLVIFYTNDVHGHVSQETGDDGVLTAIGYDRLDAIVKGEKTPHLLLDAGDAISGVIFANIRSGDLVAQLLPKLGYDALAAGNHEFDYGYFRLLALQDTYGLPYLSANVTKSDGSYLFNRFMVKEVGGLRVGILGISTPMTATTTDPRNVAGLDFGTPEQVFAAARDAVNELLDERADLVIALTHLGSEAYCEPSSIQLARGVPSIDLIVDGHSHSVLKDGIREGDTLIVSTGAYLANLGRVEVTKRAGGGYDLSAGLISASEAQSTAPDAEMTAVLKTFNDELNVTLDVVVAHAPFELDGARERVRTESTNLGRIICESLIRATGADVGFLNSGAIRASVPKGEITRGQVLSVLPYGNYICTVDMKGSDLLDALNFGLSQPKGGGFPQFYGMTVTAVEKEGKLADESPYTYYEAKTVMVGDKPLDNDAVYSVATNDFLAVGGDGFEMFSKYTRSEFGTLEEALLTSLTTAGDAALQAINDANVLTIEK
jgi:2',3'-cyclic-nucleotide 2'-phosphodiesterase (5'-nucleotidase family)